MDVPLYGLALVAFGILYLVIGVYLVFVLAICLILIYLYLVLRYDRLPDAYPYDAADTMVTATFIGVTWGIFTLLAPKNPVPLVGSGLTYTASSAVPLGAIIAIAVVLLIGFVAVATFVVPGMRQKTVAGRQGRTPAGSAGGGSEK